MTHMQITKATETLRTHNAWRRGNDESIQATDPTELWIAIDTVLESHAEMLVEIEALRTQVKDAKMDAELAKEERNRIGVEMRSHVTRTRGYDYRATGA